MGSLVSRVVTRISSLPQVQAATYTSDGIEYDYAIGGLPFLSAAGEKFVIRRKTAPYKKEQFDTASTPGEQSLASWWLRSQSSFHGGTGILYVDPDGEDQTSMTRFSESMGVDVFTPGKVQLLKETSLNVSSASSVLAVGASPSGTDYYLQAEGATLKRATDGASSSITWGGAGSILSLASDGTNYYAADSTGVYSGVIATAGAGSKVWDTGSSSVVIAWAKQRLFAGIGASLYELVGTGPGLPTANYTHPNSGWTWTAITEGPRAIYAAGYAGDQSAIYKVTLDNTGATPTLKTAVVTAMLPQGELVYGLYGYLGTYVAIGTNKGVRIAVMDDQGDLSYGPLIINFDDLTADNENITSPLPVRAFVGKDRFLYCGMGDALADGTSGLACIDLSTQLSPGRFAWANHLQSGVNGAVRSVALFGTSGRLVFGVDSSGSYLEKSSTLVSSGYLTTGRIRMRTVEPKLFKFVKLRAAPLAGTITVTAIASNDAGTSIGTIQTAGETDLDELAVPTSFGPQEYVSLKFTLARSASDTTQGPELTGYQLKALPAQKNARLFQLPLLCFDKEKDGQGNRAGYEGRAIERLAALESIEELRDIVQFQDLTRHPQETRQVVIDDIDFIQSDPPASASGWGGVVVVTLRTVT